VTETQLRKWVLLSGSHFNSEVLTISQYGITSGCELAIATRSFVYDQALLAEFGPNEDNHSENESGYEPKIKAEDERSAVKSPSTQPLHLSKDPIDDQIEQHRPCDRFRRVGRKEARST
jgi:hypothetical protein